MNGKTILVIDDDTAVRSTVRLMLERAGYQVREADDGEQGVKLYRDAGADLVITDLFMPLQDGIETIQQLRAEFPGARILAVSGGSSLGAEGPLIDAQMLGADETLAKPFSKEELLRRVRELIDPESRIDPE
jgi:two-component system, chemotaxis family, chemotaxis protein CheY